MASKRWSRGTDSIAVASTHLELQKAREDAGMATLTARNFASLTDLSMETPVMGLAWSPDGQHLVSGGVDETVTVWSAVTGDQVRKFTGHTGHGGMRSVAWSPNSEYIVSGSGDGMVRLWDAATGEQVKRCPGHTNWVQSVAWSPNSQYIISGSMDGTVRVWDTASGQEVWKAGHTDMVHSVAWSPNFQHVVSGSEDNTVKVWDAATGKEVWKCTGHTDSVKSVAWSPNGKHIVSGSEDETIRVWDAATGKEVKQCIGHAGPVSTVAWSPDGKHIVSGSEDDTVRVWDAAEKQVKWSTGHTDKVISVAWSPDGRHIASGSDDDTIRVMSTPSGGFEFPSSAVKVEHKASIQKAAKIQKREAVGPLADDPESKKPKKGDRQTPKTALPSKQKKPPKQLAPTRRTASQESGRLQKRIEALQRQKELVDGQQEGDDEVKIAIEGVVYLLKEKGNRFYKIGCSSQSAEEEKQDYQMGNPRKLETVCESKNCADMYASVAYYHDQFKEYGGTLCDEAKLATLGLDAGAEWFFFSDQVAEEARQAIKGHDGKMTL